MIAFNFVGHCGIQTIIFTFTFSVLLGSNNVHEWENLIF